MSDYYALAKTLLQVPDDQDLQPDGEWPHYDFESDSWTFPVVYPGELSAGDDQRLTMRVCGLVPTLTVEHWSKLDEENRMPWLEQALVSDALASLAVDSKIDTQSTSVDARALAVFIEHPDWTKKMIADHLKVHEKSLAPSRCPKLDAAIKAYKAKPTSVRGSKDANGDVEAWEAE